MKFLTNDTKMAELSKATHTEFSVKHCNPRISGAGKGFFMNKDFQQKDFQTYKCSEDMTHRLSW